MDRSTRIQWRGQLGQWVAQHFQSSRKCSLHFRVLSPKTQSTGIAYSLLPFFLERPAGVLLSLPRLKCLLPEVSDGKRPQRQSSCGASRAPVKLIRRGRNWTKRSEWSRGLLNTAELAVGEWGWANRYDHTVSVDTQEKYQHSHVTV